MSHAKNQSHVVGLITILFDSIRPTESNGAFEISDFGHIEHFW